MKYRLRDVDSTTTQDARRRELERRVRGGDSDAVVTLVRITGTDCGCGAPRVLEDGSRIMYCSICGWDETVAGVVRNLPRDSAMYYLRHSSLYMQKDEFGEWTRGEGGT